MKVKTSRWTALAALVFLQWAIFDVYVYLNVQSVGERGRVVWLMALCVSLGTFWIFASRGEVLRRVIRLPLLLFLVFIGYFSYRCMRDDVPIDVLKAYLFGTDSGMVLYGLLGAAFACALSVMLNEKCDDRRDIRCSFVVLAIAALSFVHTGLLAFEFYERRIEGYFLISGVNGLYQRAGDLLTIRAFSLYALTGAVTLISIRNITALKQLELRYANFLVLVNILLSAVLAQAMGANKATLLLLTYFAIAAYSFLWMHFAQRKLADEVNRGASISAVFRKTSRVVFNKFLLLAGLFVSSALLLASYLGLTPSMFRMFGYGSWAISSFTSRFELLRENFIPQFSYSPIWGNVNVDRLTTGEGTYVHSVFVYPLTHTGVVGFLIFVIAIYLGIRAIYPRLFWVQNDHPAREAGIHLLLMKLAIVYICVLVVGAISSSIHWAVLWYFIGFSLSAVSLRNFGDASMCVGRL